MSRKHKWKLNGVERYDLLMLITHICYIHSNTLVVAIAMPTNKKQSPMLSPRGRVKELCKLPFQLK